MTNKKEEWGNIQLPGLSDEELYSKNWDMLAKNREQAKDPKWIQAHAQGARRGGQTRKNDPTWYENTQQALKQVYQDSTWRENIANANKQKAKDPAWREKIAQANVEKAKDMLIRIKNDPKYAERLKKSLERRSQDPEWKRKNQQALANNHQRRKKPIITPEGVFDSIRDAAQHYARHETTIREKIFKRVPGWSFVNEEDYGDK